MNQPNHKSKYRIRHFDYFKKGLYYPKKNPINIKLAILFSGIMPLMSQFFILSGFTILIPILFMDLPVSAFFWFMLFLILEILLMIISLKKRFKNLYLIQTGKNTTEAYFYSEQTNVTINNNSVYRYYFEFKADDGNTYRNLAETHTGRLRDEAQEFLVYNPINPIHSVMIDEISKNVKNYVILLNNPDKNNNLIPEN